MKPYYIAKRVTFNMDEAEHTSWPLFPYSKISKTLLRQSKELMSILDDRGFESYLEISQKWSFWPFGYKDFVFIKVWRKE